MKNHILHEKKYFANVRELVEWAGEEHDDKIAYSCESGKRLWLAAIGEDEALHLRETARNKSGPRVVAEAHSVRAADGNRNDVLDSAADLDADWI